MFQSEKAVATKLFAPTLTLLAYGLSLTGQISIKRFIVDAIIFAPLAIIGLWLIISLVEISFYLGNNYLTAFNYWIKYRIPLEDIHKIERRLIGYDNLLLKSGKRIFFVRGKKDDMTTLF